MRVAEVYHQETKYHEREMFRHQRKLDPSRQPRSYKSYHAGEKIQLASYLSLKNNPFTKETQAEEKETPFGKGALARLLYAANGMTGILKYPDGQSTLLRAAPTAGGLYPTEIYLAIRSVPYLANGIYNFQVNDHSLVLVWEGDYWGAFQKYCMGYEAIASSSLLMILTAVYTRSTWRYADRAYRRILLDTGHILGNITAYAPEEGFTPYPIGGFCDSGLNTLMFLDPLEEGVLTVVALPQHHKESLIPMIPSAIPSRPHMPQVESKTRALELHFASSIVKDENGLLPSLPVSHPYPVSEQKDSEGVVLSPLSLSWPNGVGATIRARRSTRKFTGEAFMQEELAAILDYAYTPALSTPGLFFNPALLTTYIVVQKVIGLASGVYQYNPHQKSVVPLKAGQFHEVTFHFCLGQDLARDAAALVIHTAHLPSALNQYGDRAYRYLHLDAGHIGERINLAAIEMGLGVSGIGGFYDDEVNTLLDLSLDSIIVYITTLGRPWTP